MHSNFTVNFIHQSIEIIFSSNPSYPSIMAVIDILIILNNVKYHIPIYTHKRMKLSMCIKIFIMFVTAYKYLHNVRRFIEAQKNITHI